jgi:hypothetical protein
MVEQSFYSGPLVAYWADSKAKKINVMDEGKNNIFYTAETHINLQQFIFHTPHNSEQVASVKFSRDGNVISIYMNDESMDVRPTSKVKGTEWVYTSPTLRNAEGNSSTITWKGFTSMLCTNESGITIARLKLAKIAITRIGSIEFMDENISQQAKDEIVVAAVSLMTLIVQLKLMASSTSNSASSSNVAT